MNSLNLNTKRSIITLLSTILISSNLCLAVENETKNPSQDFNQMTKALLKFYILPMLQTSDMNSIGQACKGNNALAKLPLAKRKQAETEERIRKRPAKVLLAIALGINPDPALISDAELVRLFRQRAKKIHPDKIGSHEEALGELQLLNNLREAFETESRKPENRQEVTNPNRPPKELRLIHPLTPSIETSASPILKDMEAIDLNNVD